MNASLDTVNYTPRHYDMNPATEDLINGEDLKDGMVVLLEASLLKEDVSALTREHGGSEYALARLKENNRWCEVTNLRFKGYDGADTSRLVQFIGVYADGTKRQRKYSTSYAWFVKKDSLPKEEPKETYPEPGKVVDEGKSDALQALREKLRGDDDSDTVTLEQKGSGRRVTVSKEELFGTEPRTEVTFEELHGENADLARAIHETRKRSEGLKSFVGISFTDAVLGQVTSVSEDEDGLKVEGVLNEKGMAFVQQDAELSMETQNDIEDDEETDTDEDEHEDHVNINPGRLEDIQSPDGPLARAMRRQGLLDVQPFLREERTTTEVVKVYGHGRPTYSRFDRRGF